MSDERVNMFEGLVWKGCNNPLCPICTANPLNISPKEELQMKEPTTSQYRGIQDLQLPKLDIPIRKFDTGATRDTDANKLDYEAFLSPAVLERYAQYLNKHRVQADGTLRDGDNWQKGMPLSVYMKSALRHLFAWWKLHRGIADPADLEESICATMFNAMGYLHEVLKAKEASNAR